MPSFSILHASTGPQRCLDLSRTILYRCHVLVPTSKIAELSGQHCQPEKGFGVIMSTRPAP